MINLICRLIFSLKCTAGPDLNVSPFIHMVIIRSCGICFFYNCLFDPEYLKLEPVNQYENMEINEC